MPPAREADGMPPALAAAAAQRGPIRPRRRPRALTRSRSCAGPSCRVMRAKARLSCRPSALLTKSTTKLAADCLPTIRPTQPVPDQEHRQRRMKPGRRGSRRSPAAGLPRPGWYPSRISGSAGRLSQDFRQASPGSCRACSAACRIRLPTWISVGFGFFLFSFPSCFPRRFLRHIFVFVDVRNGGSGRLPFC